MIDYKSRDHVILSARLLSATSSSVPLSVIMSDTHPSKLKRGIVKRFLRKTGKVFKIRSKSKSRPSPIASPSCNRSSSLSAPQAEPSSQNKPFENIQLPAQTSKVSALSLDQGASVAQSGPKAASVTTQPTIESKEKNGGKSWKALATALHALHKTSKPLPMLQSVVGTLVPCLDTLQVCTIKTERRWVI